MSITLSLLLHAFSLLPLNESTVEIADNDSKVVVVVVVVLLVPDDFISCTFLVMICQWYAYFFPYLCRNQSHLHEQGTTQNPSLINHHLMEKVHLKQQLYGSLLLMNQVQSVLSAWKTFRVSFFGNKERIFDATFITWWCICFAGKIERSRIKNAFYHLILIISFCTLHSSVVFSWTRKKDSKRSMSQIPIKIPFSSSNEEMQQLMMILQHLQFCWLLFP